MTTGKATLLLEQLPTDLSIRQIYNVFLITGMVHRIHFPSLAKFKICMSESSLDSLYGQKTKTGTAKGNSSGRS